MLVSAGCAGVVGDAEGSADDDPAAPGVDGDGLPPHLRHSPGVRLLTQREYVHTVEDALGVRLPPARVPLENVVGGHGQIALEQGVTLGELDAYLALGLEAAEAAVAALDCDEVTCARAWAEPLLRRLFRRAALDPETHDEYLAMLESPEAGADVRARLVTLVSTALASPHFLYRRELGLEPTQADGHRRLAPDELAGRLSFLVWQTGPDDALLAAAERGALDDPEGRRAALDRLLADPRARPGLRGFVHDWLYLTKGPGIASKDPEVLAGTTPALVALATESLDRTIDDVLWTGEGRFPALLSADRYVVRGELAGVLGFEDTPAAFESRPVDTSERRGLLMHPAVVAAHTKESGVSPFNLGKLVYEQVLCEVIGSPPFVPEFPEPSGGTLRETLESATDAAACRTCHAKIGPPGFAFLPLDPIGRHTAADPAGRPWDTTGTIPVGDGWLTFSDAPDMVAALAAHEATARCVARRLFRFAQGHFEGAADDAALAALERVSVSSGGDVVALLHALVSDERFALVRITPEPTR